MKTKLTPSFIETLNLKSEKQYYGDTEVSGLVLVITKFVYRRSWQANKSNINYTKLKSINYEYLNCNVRKF